MKPDKSMTNLLAKSRRNGKELPLNQHLIDTEDAAQRIFRLDKRWGQNWCRFFKLNDSEMQERFLPNLRVAALFHDIGKANEEFQKAVTSSSVTQTLRHEHLSALVLCLGEIRKWLRGNPALDVDVITAAVLSHHLKASHKGDWKWAQPRAERKQVILHFDNDQVKSILERIKNIASLNGVPPLPNQPWTENGIWEQVRKQGKLLAENFQDDLADEEHQERQKLLLAVKAGVIVADSAASGLVRNGFVVQDSDWIEKIAHSADISATEITTKIINERLQEIARKKKKESVQLHKFQERIAVQGPRVLLLAACAAGKTLAAWNWAQAQAQASERKIGSVIFLYPTRGTATEGFRDYVGWAPEAEGAYVAGDAQYVLEGIAANPSEATTEKKYEQLREDQARLYALGLWSRRFFSATVDQFLGFLEHNYTGMCLLPRLADSAVIIDEVHSFDPQMFESLISFLKTFDIPVLCMTATLPPVRQKRLENCGLRVFPNEQERADLSDLKDTEDHPRYTLKQINGQGDALSIAAEAYRKELRVLWVVNTVDRCQNIARLLSGLLEKELRQRLAKVLSYHSRFTLDDRLYVHGRTVKAFQQRDIAAIAVTTQVCEMSLDLDADVLISEVAPVTSLVQRFGRANRDLQGKSKDFRALLYTYEPEGKSLLPYQKDEIELAIQFLQHLGEGDISQKQMADALKEFSIKEPNDDDVSASFLTGGYYAVRGSFRDTEELTVPSILHTDLEAVKNLVTAKKAIDGFIVGVPKEREKEKGSWIFTNRPDYERPGWIPTHLSIADGNRYEKDRGFLKPIFNDLPMECQ